jgi:hypothetical protein
MDTRLLIAYLLIGLMITALVVGGLRLRSKYHEDQRVMRGHGRYKRRRVAPDR